MSIYRHFVSVFDIFFMTKWQFSDVVWFLIDKYMDGPDPLLFNPKTTDKFSQDPLTRQGKPTDMSKTIKIARSAETGRFIPMKEAAKHPKTTVVETVKVGSTKQHK